MLIVLLRVCTSGFEAGLRTVLFACPGGPMDVRVRIHAFIRLGRCLGAVSLIRMSWGAPRAHASFCLCVFARP